MRVVVYADILFLINVYVTYALLLLTDLLCREKSARLRRLLGALLGGAYAFILFVPGLPKAVLSISRLCFAAVLVLLVYGKASRKQFFLRFGSFFAVNFAFAGLMFAVWHLFHPRSMLCSGAVVYFNINTLFLAVCTIVCYAAFRLLHLLFASRSPNGCLFLLQIMLDGRTVCCRALLDSGNDLREPFSGLPVLAVDRKVCAPLLQNKDLTDPETAARLCLRWIPCRSLAGESQLQAFRPDGIYLRGTACEGAAQNVYIALTDALHKGEFRALLHPAVTETLNEKEGCL